MRAEVELTAGPADPGPNHYDSDPDGCQCRTCKRRRAMLEPGLVPRVDGVTGRSFQSPPYREPDPPFRHPDSGEFLSPPHPIHDGRDIRGRYAEDGVYDD